MRSLVRPRSPVPITIRLSTAFFQNVNKVLTGGESGKDAVQQVEKVGKRLVR